MTDGKLSGKRALVTGAGTGIGKGIALALAREGADVVLHHFQEAEGAEAAAEAIRAMGRRALVLAGDFTVLDDVFRIGREAVDGLGGLDALVNNAGVTVNRPLETTTPAQYETLYAVNVRAPFFLTQTVLPALLESRGGIVNLASVHAFEGFRDHAAYAGTKGAIVAFTRELAIELAPRGVRVNAIAPGAVAVENYFKIMPGYDPEAAGRDIPCGFVGQPDDIGRVAAFLLSDESRYLVGQTIVVDGGTTSWMPFGEGYRNVPGGQFGQGYVPDL